ncbi:hypothetical protein QJQ45_007866 [Haematococcus lacustris]|nr:hypothetical protein QJQ45_007866 [Haematococcus lacustris]
MFMPESANGDSCPVLLDKSALSWITLFLVKFAKPVAAPPEEAAQPRRRHPKPTGYKLYTVEEVAQHNSPDDAWLIIEDKIFDVSAMQHPGGDVIFSYAGRDASELFNVMHKNQPRARAMLKAHLIGGVLQPQRTALLRDWDAMRTKFHDTGLMDASPLYYTRKIVELLAMISTSLYLLYCHNTSPLAMLASSLLMAMFMFQCGWTQHDFLHNQVFRSHQWNAFVGGLVISLGLGGSSHWWKSKHNQHHATPNKMSSDNTQAVDPDIDTVPLIAWSEALLKQVNLPDRGLIMLQHIITWPLLLVALVNWQAQSFIHCLSVPNIPAKQRRWEIGTMLVHHAIINVSIFYCLGLRQGLVYWLIAHCAAGFGTSFVFIQSHNAMEIYTDDKDFVTSQMVSTRNINPGLLADWLMGGLNYQIEHHLFPTMPRHSFSRVRRDIMEFCARHNLPYESCSIWEATAKVYRQLACVAKMA